MRLFLSIVLCLGLTRVDAQVVMTFETADGAGLRVSQLERTYSVELGEDETLYVPEMDGRQEMEMFVALRYQLADSLKAWGFRWERTTSVKNRVFFNTEGRLDYFFYSTAPHFTSPMDCTRFEDMLVRFFRTYQLPQSPSTLIVRCAPITFLASE